MPSPVLLLLIATLLPLAGFVLLLFVGKRFGNPLAGWVSSAFAVASFGCTGAAMVNWYYGARGAESWGFAVRPILRTIAWLPGGIGTHAPVLEIGVYIDSLTVAVFAMVTLAAAVAHIFSVGYLRRDEDASRVFAWLGLAGFAMLGMTLSATLVQVLGFWGLIGVSSYLLVGSRMESGASSHAALRTFVFNRLGDCSLLVGFGLLFSKLGNASLPVVWATLGDGAGGHAALLPDGTLISVPFLTFIGLSLFFGAAARWPAQFPLHLWISSASDGPIPATVTLCTITTTAAGIYLVGRLFPNFTPDARLLVAVIGLTTLTLSALIALTQRDLPRLLAWIAVSQFGYMVLAFGVGSWVGGLFHLITDAFIMSALFLAAGNVIAVNDGQRDMLKLAGGWKHLPVTASAFAVGALALSGAPFLSKYYSQSMILSDSAAFATFATGAGGRAWGYWLFFVLPIAAGCLIAFSIARCWMLSFHAKAEEINSPGRVREQPALWVPMLVLIVPAVVAGYAMNVPELLQRSMIETTTLCEDIRAQNPGTDRNHFTAFDQAWPAFQPPVAVPDAADAVDPTAGATSRAGEAHKRGQALGRLWLLWTWWPGIVLAVVLYWRGAGMMARVVRRAPLRWVCAWLDNEMYFAELYDWTVVKLVQGFAKACDVIDRYVLDGFVRLGAWVFRRVILLRLLIK